MIQYPFPVSHCEIAKDLHLAYVDEGAGPQTILFVHGLANYVPVFKPNIQGLKSQFRCMAIDLPGNGLSSRGEFPNTLLFYAECLAKFIEANKLSRVVLAGHSMGGQISIILALKYPHLVEKLVLLAPSGIENFTEMECVWMKSMLSFGSHLYGDPSSLKSAIESSFYKNSQQQAKWIVSDLVKLLSKENAANWRKMVQGNIEAMLNEPVFGSLKNIACPVLILFGKHDFFIPNKLIHLSETVESIAKKGAALIPNCQYEIVQGAGHFLQIETADLVNQKIAAFMAN